MIDLTCEQLLTLRQAAARLPRRRAGRKASVSTVYRWTTRGCRGVQLDYLQVGATRCTSVEALGRFFGQLTTAASGPSTVCRSASNRERAIRQADEELAKDGI